MNMFESDAMLSRLAFRYFRDDPFKIGQRRGDFDFPFGRIKEGKHDFVLGIFPLAEMDRARGKHEIDRSRADGERGRANGELPDLQGGGDLTGSQRWARRVWAKARAIEDNA
jgi:hypothetical protein